MSSSLRKSSLKPVSIRLLGAVCLAAALAMPANAQGRLEARYAVTMTGLAVGTADWTLDLGGDRYAVEAKGRASGLLSALVNGEGTVSAQGAIKDGRPVPALFTSRIVREDDRADTRMDLRDGAVTGLMAETPKPIGDRVPVTEAHRKGIVDPLSAMLVPSAGAVSKEACARTLPIFDGRRRYDLALSFKRMDKVKAEKGYAGPVAVCAVRFKAQAGHRASSALVKFLAEGRDIELWLAPVAGTRLLAPFRASVASLFGSLVIEATQFEAVMQTAAAR